MEIYLEEMYTTIVAFFDFELFDNASCVQGRAKTKKEVEHE